MKLIKKISYQIKISFYLLTGFFVSFPAFAGDNDPATKTGVHIANILFGQLGGAVCAIFIAATFIQAKTGKCSWDRFIFVAFCVAGYLGSLTIVNLIRSWVS